MRKNILTITTVSNITVEPFMSKQLKNILDNEYVVEVNYINYCESYSQNYERIYQKSNIIILWINYEYEYDQLLSKYTDIEVIKHKLNENIMSFCNMIENKSHAKIFFVECEDFYESINTAIDAKRRVHHLVNYINELVWEKKSELYQFIDLKHIIADRGIGNSYNIHYKNRWGLPYETTIIECVADEIGKSISKKKIKCIVLDCDNVLWKGTLIEDGIKNIKISGIYYEFQKVIVDLYNKGIVIALCTKNDYEDLDEVWENVPNMILKREQIACIKANWDNKFINIKDISQTLQLSLENMMFIDDSTFEIESAKQFLPELNCIRFEEKNILVNISKTNFFIGDNVESIRTRHNTYKNNVERKKCWKIVVIIVYF